MKTTTGPWAGQVGRFHGFWDCRAYNEETKKSYKGDCELGFHGNLFWARRCAKRKARKLNKKQNERAFPDGWFNA